MPTNYEKQIAARDAARNARIVKAGHAAPVKQPPKTGTVAAGFKALGKAATRAATKTPPTQVTPPGSTTPQADPRAGIPPYDPTAPYSAAQGIKRDIARGGITKDGSTFYGVPESEKGITGQRRPASVPTPEEPIKTIGERPKEDFNRLSEQDKVIEVGLKQVRGQELSDDETRFLLRRNIEQQERDKTPIVGGLPFTIEQFMAATPEQQMALRQLAFNQEEARRKGALDERFTKAEDIIGGQVTRAEEKVRSERERLGEQTKEAVDLFTEEEKARTGRTIGRLGEVAEERKGDIKSIQSFSGFGRSTATMDKLSKVGKDLQNAVFDIEEASGRAIRSYEMDLLARNDEEINRLKAKVEEKQDLKDVLELQKLEAEDALEKELFKQNPSNPEQMFKTAEEIKRTRIAEKTYALEERKAIADSVSKNFEFMVGQFGSEWVNSLPPEAKANYAGALGVTPEVLNNMGLTKDEQNLAWEQLKYAGTQEFELQKLLLGNEFDQQNAITAFNRELQKLGIEQSFEWDKLANTQEFEVDLLSLKESVGDSKELAKWNNLIGDLGNEYGSVALGADSDTLTFGTPIPHPADNIPVTSLNVALAQAYPDGFRFKKTDGTGGLGGQCKWFSQELTTLNGNKWSIGNSAADTKKNLDNYVKKGDAFYPGEEEIQVGQTIITNNSATNWHSAVVNGKTPDGKLVLSESNFKGPLTVSNSRVLDPNDSSIQGVLKTEPASTYKVPKAITDSIAALSAGTGIDFGFGTIKKALTSKGVSRNIQGQIEKGMNDLIAMGQEEIAINIEQMPIKAIASNPFLSSVRDGTTELSLEDEQSLAKARPDIMPLYYKAKGMGGGDQASASDIRMLRNEFYKRPRVVNADESVKNYEALEATFQGFQEGRFGSNAVDQGLIIMFNKMLDPGSVVREGEYERTRTGQSAISAIQGNLTKLQEGGAGISDQTRADMVALAKELADASQSMLQREIDFYSDEARRLGTTPDRILGIYGGQSGGNDINSFVNTL